MELKLTLITGLIAALIMFLGDMLLYYDSKDYVSDGSYQPIIDIMSRVSKRRLYLGGFLGPIAAFLYCIGYLHIILIAQDKLRCAAYILTGICCLAIIIGGTFHSHCTYLGLLGKKE